LNKTNPTIYVLETKNNKVSISKHSVDCWRKLISVGSSTKVNYAYQFLNGFYENMEKKVSTKHEVITNG